MITVLIVDDQPLARAGIRSIIDAAEDLCCVGEAGDGTEALELVRGVDPDVVLMDLRMPGMDGVAATEHLRGSRTRVLILTTFDGDPEIQTSLRAGAAGFLEKASEPEAIRAAIRQVATDQAALSQHALQVALRSEELPMPTRQADVVSPTLAARIAELTPRERDVVLRVAEGKDNDAIGVELFISPLTVKTHLGRAMAKLHARDRAQLVVIAFRSGLSDASP
ncbi:response regulator [Curtobacterium flaccumfaciens]|uniref:response regulator n=1 Tax=Curtobacterium flaccumfaciens TaxID=2035 RepID=UPI001E3AE352|nr:response regulator transcription factor [Curtobacterium allii]MCE0459741.1 response regulator transcription factor [Curtobacterium allii]